MTDTKKSAFETERELDELGKDLDLVRDPTDTDAEFAARLVKLLEAQIDDLRHRQQYIRNLVS